MIVLGSLVGALVGASFGYYEGFKDGKIDDTLVGNSFWEGGIQSN